MQQASLGRGDKQGRSSLLINLAAGHPAFLVDLLEVVDLGLDLVPVERHLNDVVLGQGVTLPSF